jgi:choline dehydrogenase-like flavoprotein
LRSDKPLHSQVNPHSTAISVEISRLAYVDTDAKNLAYARSISVVINHVNGGMQASRPGASWGVVDPDFRGKGADKLRVVDASVFVSATHPFWENKVELIP